MFHLSRFFHEDVVILEAHRDQLLPLEGCVCASHGNDLGLLDAEVPGSIEAGSQQLESPELVQLSEDVLQQQEEQHLVKLSILNTNIVFFQLNTKAVDKVPSF